VAYNPVGDIIIAGFGGSDGSSGSKVGAIAALNEEDLSVIREIRDSNSPISLVTFSPEGETLAVAAEDGAIYLYSVQEEYELIGRCVRHDTKVIHIDFSLDGEWLRTNSLANDLCFFNADDASYQSNYPAMRDVQWATSTCTRSWHVQGLHRSPFPGESVTSVHTCAPSSSFLACATNFGYLKLYSFPCASDMSEYHRFPAHCGSIASVRFSFDGKFLISIGLEDGCIAQWICSEYAAAVIDELNIAETDDFVLEARDGSEIDEEMMPISSTYTDAQFNESSLNGKPLGGVGVDVWLETVVAPSNPPNQNRGIPNLSLSLEYVYGYKSQDMRNNVRYTDQGEFVFVCASLGIRMNRGTRAQNFYNVRLNKIFFFLRHCIAINFGSCSNLD
jgi:WD40 repeat protein